MGGLLDIAAAVEPYTVCIPPSDFPTRYGCRANLLGEVDNHLYKQRVDRTCTLQRFGARYIKLRETVSIIGGKPTINGRAADEGGCRDKIILLLTQGGRRNISAVIGRNLF